MTPLRIVPLAFVVLLLAVPAAATAQLPEVSPQAESEPNFEDDGADADDPAIWVNPLLRGRSIVVGTLKDAGLTVFDLDGDTLQDVAAPPAPGEEDAIGRFNNVDVVYGARVGKRFHDLAIVSDRGRDQIRTFAVDLVGASLGVRPLRDITADDPPFVFNDTQEQVNEQATAYGVAAWVDERSRVPYVVTSRRSRTELALLKLVPGSGGVSYEQVDGLTLPSSFPIPGGTFTPCIEAEGEGPQVEGMTVDADRGLLFAAQEDVGIWRVKISRNGFSGAPVLIEKVKEFGAPYELIPDEEDPGEFECEITGDAPPGVGGEHIAADAEGLTIYRGAFGSGYLLASSQGDDTFHAFADRGLGGYLGGFSIGESGSIDSVQESDGAAVINVPLGSAFPRGLFATHDGDDENSAGEDATNFKLTRWENVARAFDPPLRVDPFGWAPRLDF
jgi:3-phytase